MRGKVLSLFSRNPVRRLSEVKKRLGKGAEREIQRLLDEGILLYVGGGRVALASALVEGVVEGREVEAGGKRYPLEPGIKVFPGDAVLGVLHRGKFKVLKVLKPTQREFTGRVEGGIVFPDAKGLKPFKAPRDAPDGSRVSIVIRKRRPRVKEVLGDVYSPDADVELVVRRFGLRRQFPPEAFEELRRALRVDWHEELSRRLDLRDALLFTIDPEDAKDFDDAVSLWREGERWVLGVHIADVSRFVREGGALDAEAEARGTSVYLLDTVIPMLPFELSAGEASLSPEGPKLAVSVFLHYDERGRFLGAEFSPSVIQSKRRLTYEEAEELLEGGGGEVGETLRRMWDLAQRLREVRFKMGYLDLEIHEPRFTFSPEGRVLDVRPEPELRSHKLIEEFMIAADRAVAARLRGLPVIYRVHAKPDPKKIKAFSELAKTLLGITVPAEPQPKDLARVLEAARGTPHRKLLSYYLLRSLKRASYSVEPVGHFGLALKEYVHFTSPIRRYPDLVVHRILKAALRGTARTDEAWRERLREIAARASAASERADKAQWLLWDLKKVEFMESKVGEVFEGIISGVVGGGLFVTIEEHLAEGFVRVPGSTFIPERFMLRRGRKVWRLGERVKVKVAKASKAEIRIDLELVER